MNINVFFTGGTIGSAGEGVVKSDANRFKLIDLYAAKYGQTDSFRLYNPYTVLSENISAEHLVKLKNSVLEAEQSDGVIITHGTDTLAYTANYLSLTLSEMSVPIVLVSSNYPLEDKRGYGLDNFAAAVKFIKEKKCARGVFAAFRNDGENVIIHRADKLFQSRHIDGYVASSNGRVAELEDAKRANISFVGKKLTGGNNAENNAQITDGEFKYYDENYKGYGTDIIPDIIKKGEVFGKVALIKSHALIDFRLYDFAKTDADAAVVELYHSGTTDTSKDGYFVDFVQRCQSIDIPVITASAPLNGNVYDGTEQLFGLPNLIYTVGLTIENVLIKAILACGSSQNKLKLLDELFR